MENFDVVYPSNFVMLVVIVEYIVESNEQIDDGNVTSFDVYLV